VKKLINLLGISLGGWLGWALATRLGGGLMSAYFTSLLGSVLGVLAAVRFCRAYLP